MLHNVKMKCENAMILSYMLHNVYNIVMDVFTLCYLICKPLVVLIHCIIFLPRCKFKSMTHVIKGIVIYNNA